MTWWQDAVGYEVYLRSFADGNGDGVGDLAGLVAHLDYLAWLGVSVVWVTPFYPSPMRDHGYDVADYTDVDPTFGSLTDVDSLLTEAQRRGLRVVVDLVPNHTSSDHPWFQQARSSRDNPFRDYYIWRDPAPDGGPPNNWASHFGGGAWTYDEHTGQYWLHLFLPEQPDLNWENPAVAAEFDDILRFWCERGVDGFRIDVAHALAKHPQLPDLPPADPAVGADPMSGQVSSYAALEHIHDVNQPGVLDVYRRWRKVVAPYGALLLGEVYVLDAATLTPYLVAADGLHLSFWFKPLHIAWSPDAVRAALRDGAQIAPGSVAWVSGSHDRPRAATRFGGGEIGKARALVLAVLLMGMPGVPFVYQGEELALEDGTVPPRAAEDPIAARAHVYEASRDGCRTPMPWAPGAGYGFTTAETPWLPFGGRTETDTVAVQRDDPDSPLQLYRQLIQWRRETTDLHTAPLVWLTDEGPVIAYRRGGAAVAANVGDHPAPWRPPARGWRVAVGTDRSRSEAVLGEQVELAPLEAVALVEG